MFKEAIIHYPTDAAVMTKIAKELAAFRCTAAVKHIQSLNLTDRQIETFYASLAEDIAARKLKSNIA